jgi:hypothetical protein
MARFVKICGPFTPINPNTDEPIQDAKDITNADIIRALFQDQRITQGLDVYTLRDLRAKLIAAKPGEYVPVDEEHWSVICQCARRSTTLSFIVIVSCEPFFRGWTDAPTEDPSAKKEAA